MMTILCAKHKEEYRASRLAVPRRPGEGWFAWSTRIKPLDNDDCPDCRIVGLNKSGEIVELSAPEDWMFHDRA